jgi:hypothetical protein
VCACVCFLWVLTCCCLVIFISLFFFFFCRQWFPCLSEINVLCYLWSHVLLWLMYICVLYGLIVYLDYILMLFSSPYASTSNYYLCYVLDQSSSSGNACLIGETLQVSWVVHEVLYIIKKFSYKISCLKTFLHYKHKFIVNARHYNCFSSNRILLI